jgi:hypothetical protein
VRSRRGDTSKQGEEWKKWDRELHHRSGRLYAMPRHPPGKMFKLDSGGRMRIYWYSERGQIRSQARAEKKARKR